MIILIPILVWFVIGIASVRWAAKMEHRADRKDITTGDVGTIIMAIVTWPIVIPFGISDWLTYRERTKTEPNRFIRWIISEPSKS